MLRAGARAGAKARSQTKARVGLRLSSELGLGLELRLELEIDHTYVHTSLVPGSGLIRRRLHRPPSWHTVIVWIKGFRLSATIKTISVHIATTISIFSRSGLAERNCNNNV